jgi:DNA gyrase subunit B
MTDADVDGSHIRTLLLTFFFRQMPELIERGHVFIAQPPLYKIKRGKQETYLKDDDALDRHLTSTALDGTSLYVSPSAPAIGGAQLEELVIEYRKAMHVVDKRSRLMPAYILEALIYEKTFQESFFEDKARVEEWCKAFNDRLTAACDPSERYEVNAFEDKERHIFVPQIIQIAHGVPYEYMLSKDFLTSDDYRQMTSVGERLEGLLEEGAYIQRGEKTREVSTFKEALDWLMTESRKGHSIQRYKGLGEMNPDQLWETTMDPESRRMLRVNIEDAIAADQIFTTLMGDHVEPRRDFIESNALDVANLDV